VLLSRERQLHRGPIMNFATGGGKAK